MKCRNAFTVVEMLVVLAIIAILAALLFPVFARARDGGHRSQCISNLHQIGTAVAMYSADYDERIPYAVAQIVPPMKAAIGSLASSSPRSKCCEPWLRLRGAR